MAEFFPSEFIVKHGAATYNEDKSKGVIKVEPKEEIVRCRDCAYYYEVDEYHPQGNYDRRCCKYFDTYSDEVEPNGFCAWGDRK